MAPPMVYCGAGGTSATGGEVSLQAARSEPRRASATLAACAAQPRGDEADRNMGGNPSLARLRGVNRRWPRMSQILHRDSPVRQTWRHALITVLQMDATEHGSRVK